MKKWIALMVGVAGLPLLAADWPQWGGDGSRNMVSGEKGLAASFEPGKTGEDGETIDLKTTKNVKWIARLGSQCYGNPAVGGGRIVLGTNNDPAKDERYQGDHGIVMCLDEATGKMVWQLAVRKLEAGSVSDYEGVGLCSPPTIEEERVYVVSNRCEVLCLDLKGMANGNDGPFKEEALYVAGKGKAPIPSKENDGDILWRYDMRDELGVFPLHMTSSSVLVVGDRIYVTTSNAVDWTHHHIPSPLSPALICLDKKTGKLLGREDSGISARMYASHWSSPALAKVEGKELIIFGGGDGFCYAFEPVPVKNARGEDVLKEVWRFDCNPKELREEDGKPIKYGSPKGPSEIVATPVAWKNRVYVAVGQNPENGDGAGALSCIDASKSGDITQSGKVWQYLKIQRSLSTPSIVEGMMFVADFAGFVHCLNPETGEVFWTHDAESKIWGSTLVADGKVYVLTEGGDCIVFAASKEKKELGKSTIEATITGTPVAANGVLYIATDKHLYAIKQQ